MYCIIVAHFLLDIFLTNEMYTNRETANENVANTVYTCTFEDGGILMEGELDNSRSDACVVYTENVGSALVVLVCMLFVQIATCRRPKKKTKCTRMYGETRRHSLRALKRLAWASKDEAVRVYYKYALDVIKEVRHASTPTIMPIWCKRKARCGCFAPWCGSCPVIENWMNRPCFWPNTRMWVAVVFAAVFLIALNVVC